MCTSVIVRGEGRPAVNIDCVRDLAAFVGRDNIVPGQLHSGTIDPDDDCCLCPVDLKAVAEKAGFDVSYDDDGDPMECIWHRRKSGGAEAR